MLRPSKTIIIVGVFTVAILAGFGLSGGVARAAINQQINYQGKLTNAAGVAVSDGNNCMKFRLMDAVSGGTELWTEEWKASTAYATTTSGLFSVMLGSQSSLSGVDFNQTIYLEVQYDATCDGVYEEVFSPRKKIGAVPAAFEAAKLGGFTASQFLRDDTSGSIATTSADTVLTITQSGAGNLLDLKDGLTTVFTALDGGRVGIGTSTPATTLDVYGDMLLDGSNRYLNFGNATGTDGYGFRDNGGTIQYKNLAGAWAGIGSGSGSSNWSFASSNAISPTSTVGLIINASSTFNGAFQVATSTGALFKVDYATGYVGIGTSTPAYTLGVTGTFGVSGITTFRGVPYTWPSADGSANTILTTDGSGSLSWSATSTLHTSLTDAIGILPTAKGGTNLSVYSAGQLFYASDANTMAQMATSSLHLDLNDGIGILAASKIATSTLHIDLNDTIGILPLTKLAATSTMHISIDDLIDGTTYKKLTAVKEAYIDQDVTSGASPSFTNANMSGNVSIWTNNAGYLTSLTGRQLGELSDVSTSTPATTGNLLKYDGANWIPAATSTLHTSLTDAIGILPTAKGGTNLSVYSAGQLFYASDANTMAQMATSSLHLDLNDGIGILAASKIATSTLHIDLNDTIGILPLTKLAATSTMHIDLTDTIGILPLSKLTLATGNVYVGDASNNPTATSSLYISSAGYIGIGTVAPSSKLTIVGGSAAISLAGTATTTISSATSTFAHGLIVDTNTLYVMADTGRVGFGTTTPQAKISLWTNTAGVDLLSVGTSTNSSILVLNSSGQLGIGTSTPAYTLGVTGTFGVSGATTFNGIAYTWPTSQDINYILQTDGSGTLSWVANAENSSNWWLATANALTPTTTVGIILNASSTINHNLSVGTSTNSTLFVDSGNGRVGINDKTPDAKLDINEDRISGILMQLSYEAAKTLAGSVTGIDLDLSTNVTPGSQNITGLNIELPSGGTGDLTFLKLIEGSSTLYDFDVTSAQFNVPASFNAAGDVSLAYDLLFTNDSAGYLKFAGPGYIQTESPSGNYDLTLSAANLGNVIINDWLEVIATTTIDTDLFFADITRNRVGIGTTTPQTIFEIAHSWAASTTAAFSINSASNSTSTPSGGLFKIISNVNSNENTVFIIKADGTLGVGTAGPDRRADILDPANPQLRLTQTDGSQYVDFKTSATGNLTITPSGNSITIPDDNFYVCASDACPALITLTGTGNLQVENDLFVGGNLAIGNASTTSAKFTGYQLAGATSTNIAGISGNNPVIRRVRVYIEDDPGVNATSTLCRLSFYSSDSMTEDELLQAFYFTLSYTETNGGASAADLYDVVDSNVGLVKYDLIRYLGGTAENVRITSATTTTNGIAFTALAGDHADDTGVVRVAEITDMFQLYDADASNEVHMKLETFEDTFNNAIDIVIELDIQ